MAREKTPQTLYTEVRVMAWMCILLGAMTILSTGVNLVMIRALKTLTGSSGALKLPGYGLAVFRFAAMSGPVMGALGLALLAAGGFALAKRRWLVPSLKLGAWASIGIMGVLAVVWAQAARAEQASTAIVVIGCALHALQALLISFALRYLRRPEVEEAALTAPLPERGRRRGAPRSGPAD